MPQRLARQGYVVRPNILKRKKRNQFLLFSKKLETSKKRPIGTVLHSMAHIISKNRKKKDMISLSLVFKNGEEATLAENVRFVLSLVDPPFPWKNGRRTNHHKDDGDRDHGIGVFTDTVDRKRVYKKLGVFVLNRKKHSLSSW